VLLFIYEISRSFQNKCALGKHTGKQNMVESEDATLESSRWKHWWKCCRDEWLGCLKLMDNSWLPAIALPTYRKPGMTANR